MYSLLARSELVAGDTVGGEAFRVCVVRNVAANGTRLDSKCKSQCRLIAKGASASDKVHVRRLVRKTERVIVRRPVGGWPHRVLRTFLHVVIGVVVEARADGSYVCMSALLSAWPNITARTTGVVWECAW
jgi:hypothetical protein